MTRPTVVIIEMDEERARKECLALNLKAIGANRELAQWLLDNPRWPTTPEAHRPRAADRPRAAGPLDYLRSGELNCRKSSLPCAFATIVGAKCDPSGSSAVNPSRHSRRG